MARPNARPRFEAKEWNACGATQFYGREKKRSYIVEVSLSEAVRGDLLQRAVDKTLQRLPYYRSTFVRKRGLYYYADNDLPFMVAQSEAPRVIGGATFVLMSETAGYFHINFTQTMASDRYYLAFAAILEELGIPCEKLPGESYLNPEVELPEEQ